MIDVDIEIPDAGEPAIAYPRGAFPVRPVFVVVVPPGGGEEEARTFAVCVDWSAAPDRRGGVFHEGARPPALPSVAFALRPVDAEAVPRLFERGSHPGDFLVAGEPADDFRRAAKAVLIFLDLSDGLDHGAKVSTPAEMRFALARAFEELGGAWARAADLLDPAALVRSGAVPALGGNPLTAEGHHRFMLDLAARADAGMDVDRHPIVDFRSLTDAELAHEIIHDGRAAAYGAPDLRRDGPGARLLLAAVAGVAAAVEARRGVPGALGAAKRCLEEALADGEPAVARLASGRGPGSTCWRNLFADEGLLARAARRAAEPDCDADLADAVGRMPLWQRRAFRSPGEVLRNRLARLDLLEARLEDRHRPFLALHLRRISASPGLRDGLAALDDARLDLLLQGTRALISAYDDLPNRHAEVAPAREALALGWRRLAAERVRRDPDWSPGDEDPGLSAAAAAMPYASVFDPVLVRAPSFRPV